MKSLVYILLTIVITIIVVVFVQEWVKAENEVNAELTCYRTLYNEDIIGNGCDKYFYQDAWYIEYRQLEKVEQ